MMTTNSKSAADLNQMSLKRNLMLSSESHIRSLDSEDMNTHMEDIIDSDKDDTNDDSETDSGSASDGEESSGQFRFLVHGSRLYDISSSILTIACLYRHR